MQEKSKYLITIIILTYNEKIHLKRCIESCKKITDKIIIIDSYSTDNTVSIAQSLGANTYQNPFINNAQQFQWALDNCEINTEWVMKIDADEYLLPALVEELKIKLPNTPKQINGYQVKCRVHFMGKWIKRGYYPMILNRIFRASEGYMEQKWMDEHIQLKSGQFELLENDIVDENLNNLTWWTQKHNNYSTREAIVRLDKKYGFLPKEYQTATTKKNKDIYLKLPPFFRGFIYFSYRYFFRLGFLDGKKGLIWHLLQGFWYQTLIDAKIYQIEYLSKKTNKTIKEVIQQDFGFKI